MIKKMKYYLSISDLTLSVCATDKLRWRKELYPFLTPGAGRSAQVNYYINYAEPPSLEVETSGEFAGFRFYKTKAVKKYFVKIDDVHRGQSREVALELSTSDMQGRIYLPEDYKGYPENELNLSAFLGIELILPFYRRIMMHSAVVCYRGMGILFTGPSGMGKSTQAGLWERLREADILNGDRAILQIGDTIQVWGSPYAGSSHIYRNESCPVRAIILLEQGKENRISQMQGKEKLMALYPRFLLAQWDGELLSMQLGLVNEILQRIPAYRLICRPDEGAVELVERTLFGS